MLAIAPLSALAVARRRAGAIGWAAVAAIGVAEAGRRREGGARVFPVSGSLLAPAWLAERALCSWLALGAKLRGGVSYGEGRIAHSATSERALRRRYRGLVAAGAEGGEETSRVPPSALNPISL
jgi:hypothetical protein